jgi:DNA primase
MSSSVEQIKSKLDIVSLIGSYIKVEKTGSNFKACCPFHNEKTPSFFISPDRGNYYCFGCQAKGDIFTFVEEFEGLDFKGALKVLADKAGVTLDNFRPEEKSDKDVLFSLMEQATFFFENNLAKNNEAKSYLKSRGATEETIKDFRIGYASSEWRELYDFLLSKGVAPEQMEKAGLVKRKAKPTESRSPDSAKAEFREGGGFYDTFRSRIIFPIADSSGRVVAFSGRIFPKDDNAPKYLNSPETPIFRKSEVLYGLDKAKKHIHSIDYSVLVEGQMDLVMLHQSGFANTVASSGTALTEEHLVRLSRLSNRLIMAFDADPAGFKAIVRGAEIALGLGMEVKVAQMTDGLDPADMALKDKEGLLKVMKDSKHIVSFVTDLVVKESVDARTLARKVVSDVLPFVVKLQSSSEQAHFIKEIHAKTGVAEDALREDLRSIKNLKIKSQNLETDIKKPVGDRGDLILDKLVGLLFWQKEKKESGLDSIDLEKKIIEITGVEKFSENLKRLEVNKESLIFQAEAYYVGKEDISSDIIELLNNLKEDRLKKEFNTAMVALSKAEALKDSGESARLFLECQRISEELKKIRNPKN